MISTILLLPHETTREQLLAPGAPVCCWLATTSLDEPTRATVRVFAFGWSVGGKDRMVWWPHDNEFTPEGEEMRGIHLTLACDGAEVYEGTDRLRHVAEASPACGQAQRIHVGMIGLEIAVLLGREPGLDPAVALERLRSIVAPLGTLLLLDSEGNPC